MAIFLHFLVLPFPTTRLAFKFLARCIYEELLRELRKNCKLFCVYYVADNQQYLVEIQKSFLYPHTRSDCLLLATSTVQVSNAEKISLGGRVEPSPLL